MNPGYVAAWSLAFAITLSVELAIVVPYLASTGLPVGSRVSICIIANLVTHPAVWFVFPFLGLGATTALILSELWAFGLEVWVYSVMLRTAPLRRCAAASFFANVASALVYAGVCKVLA